MAGGEADRSDEWLVAQTLSGNQEAFATLVRRYRRAAIATALSIVGDPTEADDVAQEVFIQAHDRLATCREPERFAAWLLTSVRRRALNQIRTAKRRRQVPLEPDLPSTDELVLTRIDRQDLRRRLISAIRQLVPVQREVVLLSDLEDWSHAQIADATGLSVLMSRRHLSDARRKLREILSNENPAEQ